MIFNNVIGKKAAKLQSKSVTYTSNGTASVTPDSGYDGLSSVNVTVNVNSVSELYNFAIANNLANSPVDYTIGDDTGTVPGGQTVELSQSTLYNILTNISIQLPEPNAWINTLVNSSTTPKTITFSIDSGE